MPEEAGRVGKLSYGLRITQLAAADPERIAVVCGDEALTRGELERLSNRMARAFVERGVAPGRLVTIGLPNGLAFVIACVATWKCGAIPNPISPRLPARERADILRLADPALVVGFDDLAHGTRRCRADSSRRQRWATRRCRTPSRRTSASSRRGAARGGPSSSCCARRPCTTSTRPPPCWRRRAAC